MAKEYPIFFKQKVKEHEQNTLLVFAVSKGESKFLIEGREYLLPQGSGVAIASSCDYKILDNKKNITKLALSGSFIADDKSLSKYSFFKNGIVLIKKCLYEIDIYNNNEKEKSVIAYRLFTDIFDNAVDYPTTDNNLPLIVETAIGIMEAESSGLYNVDEIAQEIGVSLPYLSREFKKYVGIGPAEYLRKVRIENAKAMLYDLSISVTMVGQLCGFSGVDYFSKVFKKEVGITPTQFRSSINTRHNAPKSVIPDEAYL